MAVKETSWILKAGDRVKERWRVISRIGGGGFGEIYKAYDTKKNQEVAVKVEKANERKQVLQMEVAVLQAIENKRHAPKFFGCGHTPEYNYLVIELLSRNLSDLRRNSPHLRFSQGTSFHLGVEALQALSDLHNAGYLHRDIKPSNFTLGLERSRTRILYLIDFGLSRKHLINNIPRPPRLTCGFRGTVRYASIHSHEGREVGRRDDLWALFYMLIEMNQGSLPWRRLSNREEVLKWKKRTGLEELCQDSPRETLEFGTLIQPLNYHSTPEYHKMEKTLLRGMESVHFHPKTSPLDWEVNFQPVKDEEKERETKGGMRRTFSLPETCTAQTLAEGERNT